MSHHPRTVGAAELDGELRALDVPVLVDFGASWCGPCRAQEPLLHQVAEHLGDRARVVAVDVDASPELGERFGVRSVPTLVVLRRGVEVKRFRGLTAAPVLSAALEAAAR